MLLISHRLRRPIAALALLLLGSGTLVHGAAARTQEANLIPVVPLAGTTVTDFPTGARSDLLLGNDGNLYFVSSTGGKGYGVVSRVAPDNTLTVVYAFASSSEAATAYAPLMQASDGNLYGSSYLGGSKGGGVVFRVSLAGTFATVHSFGENKGDPALPYGGLVQAGDGNLYGTTLRGGANDKGTVYRLTLGGDLSVIHEFNGDDGWNPESTLIVGNDGNLYGTTLQGGTDGRGTVFRISTTGTFSLLYSFPSLGAFNSAGVATNSTGANPRAGLTLGIDGNYYGTAYQGGASGVGTVFRMTPTGTVTVLHAFTGPSFGGGNPLSGVTQDAAGNFYGTTERGGYLGSGSAYRISASGQFSLLHGFTGLTQDGSTPYAGITLVNGVPYGVSSTDVITGRGAVYKLDLGTSGALPLEFSISQTAITVGSSVVLSWTGPAGSTCTRVGSAWGSTDTTAPVTATENATPATAGLYTYVLSCVDAATVAHIAYATVVVSAPPKETVDGGGGTGALSLLPLLLLAALLAALLSRKYFKETVSKCP